MVRSPALDFFRPHRYSLFMDEFRSLLFKGWLNRRDNPHGKTPSAILKEMLYAQTERDDGSVVAPVEEILMRYIEKAAQGNLRAADRILGAIDSEWNPEPQKALPEASLASVTYAPAINMILQHAGVLPPPTETPLPHNPRQAFAQMIQAQ